MAFDPSKVRLKKTSLPEPKVHDVQLCDTSEQYQQMMEETYLEKYFNAIQSFSFPAIFRPLSRNQAKAINSFHQQKGTYTSWKDNENLRELEKDIEETMTKAGWKSIFVRLSSRSPKDAALLSPK